MSQVSSRLPLLDTAKGLACAAIVAHHLAFYGPMSDIAQPLAPDLMAWLYDYARMAVQIFLVLGGYLAAASLAPEGVARFDSAGQQVGKRFVRLVVPYVVALLVTVLVTVNNTGTADATGRRAVAYLEVVLPDDPTGIDLAGDAYEDLDSAIYLGRRPDRSALLTATTRSLPLRDPEQVVVPWGDNELLLVPRGQLVGGLLATLPLLIATIGGVLVLAFAALALRLQRTGRRAEGLAQQNEELYLEQQHVAQTLQRQLLPDALPADERIELAHRYQSGVAGIEVGGDWYDAVLVDRDRRLVFTVGDVSGQGLPAATVMITLRIAVRAWATEGDGPAVILQKLDRMLDVRADGHFATVLCGSIELATGRMVLASAGHPVPMHLGAAGASPVAVRAGLPVGVGPDAYQEVELQLDPGDVLVGFTDGLFERRDELVDEGMERVRRTVATLADRPPAAMVEELVASLAAGESPDDTAVLAVRWTGAIVPASA